MYQDVMLKTQYYKKQIVRSLLSKGVDISNSVIADKLNDIDLQLALFKHQDQLAYKNVNIDAINISLNIIMQDLTYLYQLAYSVAVQEFGAMQNFAEAHLQELENTATYYKTLATQETNVSTLGNTIFFQYNNFDLSTTSTAATINLGTIKLSQASKIACVANIGSVEAQNVIFHFGNKNHNFSVTAYNYNKETAIVPGTLKKQTYNLNLNANQIVNGSIILNIDSVDQDKQYMIYAGANKLSARSEVTNQISVIDKGNTMASNTFSDQSMISFYTVGCSTVTFNFNQMPINTNFDLKNYVATGLKPVNYFSIECAKDFAMDFTMDKGSLYADRSIGDVVNNQLFYPKQTDIKDFYIEAYDAGVTEEYNLTVEVLRPIKSTDISGIIIKEIDKLGGVTA